MATIARYRCPNGCAAWDGPHPDGPTVRCPRCFETFPLATDDAPGVTVKYVRDAAKSPAADYSILLRVRTPTARMKIETDADKALVDELVAVIDRWQAAHPGTPEPASTLTKRPA